MLTLLSQPLPLVSLQLVLSTFSQHRRIAPCLGKVQLHRLVEELEAIHLVDGAHRGVDIVENDERLAFGFQVRLGNQIDDVAILGEDLAEGFLELGRFYSLLEVFNVDTVVGPYISRGSDSV